MTDTGDSFVKGAARTLLAPRRGDPQAVGPVLGAWRHHHVVSGDREMIVLGIAAAAAASWVVAPIVGMARRGTVDQQTLAAWDAEGRAAQIRRTEHRALLVRAAEIAVPEPRRAPDDLPQRSTLAA